jgi:hypothetical protein
MNELETWKLLMMSFQGALMLRQFNVYRNTYSNQDKLPYYMLIQDDYYDDLATRVFIHGEIIS